MEAPVTGHRGDRRPVHGGFLDAPYYETVRQDLLEWRETWGEERTAEMAYPPSESV